MNRAEAARAEVGAGPLPFVLWITVTTILVALVPTSVTENLVRPLFFSALLAFFVGLGRRARELRSLAFRLIELGLLFLSVGSLLGAVLRQNTIAWPSAELSAFLAQLFDRGAGFLLGFSLIAYGIVLWVPEVLDSRKRLAQDLAKEQEDSEEKGRALAVAQDALARQEALALVGELAAGVAHELRNPLAVVHSALQSFADRDLSAADRTRCLEVMERAVDKANRRIAGLLDLGRAGDFHPKAIDAGRFLRTCADLARPEARLAGVEIQVADPRAELWADPDLLLQVCLNLSRNAIQAGPHTGPIHLRCEPGPGGSARIEIRDEGRGIEPAVLDRLFTPFYSTKEDGTGLGLTVSSKLVEKHGGRLWLEAVATGGVRAVLELPGPPRAPRPEQERAVEADV